MKNQDKVVLQHIAAQTCDYHKDGFDNDCGFCSNALKAILDAFEYGKSGTLPFSVAVKVLNG